MGTDADHAPEDLPGPAPSTVSPDVIRSYRWQLTPGEDVIDTATWAGSAERARNGRRGRRSRLPELAIELLREVVPHLLPGDGDVEVVPVSRQTRS